MTGLFPAVVFSLALIYCGVKTEPSETCQLAGKGRRGLGQRCCPHLPVWVGKGILGLLFREKKKCTPATEVHLIQNSLPCLYCVQAVSAATPFLALEADQDEAVKPVSIGVTHAISI